MMQFVLTCKENLKKSLYSKFQNLENMYDFVVKVIEKSLNQQTKMTNDTIRFPIRDKITDEIFHTSPSTERIIQISPDMWTRIMGYRGYFISSFYLPKCGKIFLKQDNWCLCNLIHESLHGVSSLSKESFAATNLEFVTEGLTELLTGYVIKSSFRKCYGYWRSIGPCFLVAYLDFVKIWFYLGKKIRFRKIVSVYLDADLRRPFYAIVDVLRSEGVNIRNVFHPYARYLDIESRFKDELSKVFGSDFAEYMDTRVTEIDLSRLRL